MANASSVIQVLQEFGVEEIQGPRGRGFKDSSEILKSHSQKDQELSVFVMLNVFQHDKYYKKKILKQVQDDNSHIPLLYGVCP